VHVIAGRADDRADRALDGVCTSGRRTQRAETGVADFVIGDQRTCFRPAICCVRSIFPLPALKKLRRSAFGKFH